MGRSLNLGILSLIMDRELILSCMLCYGSSFTDGYTLKLKSISTRLNEVIIYRGGGGGEQKITREKKELYYKIDPKHLVD